MAAQDQLIEPAAALSIETTANKKTHRKSIASFIAGGGAGMISTTVLQPLDVIKTHMQAAESSKDREMKAIVRRIVSQDGAKGLWRGTGPACVRVGLGAGLYFAVLGPVVETMKEAFGDGSQGGLHERLPAIVTLSAGAVTRGIASSVVCPITVIKTRMECSRSQWLWDARASKFYFFDADKRAAGRAGVQYAAASGLLYRNTFHAVQTITFKEGLPGLYSGLIPTLARDAPYSGLYLLMYNRLQIFIKENMPPGNPQAPANFLAGAVAGGCATLLTHPPDVIRTRMQLDQRHKSGIVSTVKHIVEANGLKGLFVGVAPRVGRRALQQAFAWTIYEEIVHRVSNKI